MHEKSEKNNVHVLIAGGRYELRMQPKDIDRTRTDAHERITANERYRDLDAVRQAIKLDPLTAGALTLPEIDRMIDNLLAANAEYLPDGLVADGS